jgi:hypothetical protein
MKSAPAKPPLFKPSEISKHHGMLRDEFARHLSDVSGIRDAYDSSGRWPGCRVGEEISFYLWGKGRNPPARGRRRRGGATCPILCAKSKHHKWDDAFAWVAWREVWCKYAPDAFVLNDASFTFFWGKYPYPDPLDKMLLRAEWNQLRPGDDGVRAEPNSGHPHWQVDQPSLDGAGDVSGIHLGMAGWECSRGQGFPNCWQRLVGNELNTLELWASTTLEYTIYQIVNCYKPG